MNQVVLAAPEFKRRPMNGEDEASREFQLYCKALETYPDANSRRPSLTFAEYLQHLQQLKVEHS